MKKLYNGKTKKIHPSPPLSSPYDLLAALPFAILTLAAALSPAEKEVLAYLLSTAGQGKVSGKNNTNHLHPPELGCGCFGCYKSFWARWDASPNRHLIHQILDAVEESAEPLSLSSGRRRRPRPRRCFNRHRVSLQGEKGSSGEEDGKDEGFEEEEEEEEVNEADEGESVNSPSAVRRLVSFIGEKVWGAWN